MKIIYETIKYINLLSKTVCITLSRYHTPYSSGTLLPDISRTLSQHIIYSDKNTSPILPKPLNRQQIHKLFDLILKLSNSKISNTNHEI